MRRKHPLSLLSVLWLGLGGFSTAEARLVAEEIVWDIHSSGAYRVQILEYEPGEIPWFTTDPLRLVEKILPSFFNYEITFAYYQPPGEVIVELQNDVSQTDAIAALEKAGFELKRPPLGDWSGVLAVAVENPDDIHAIPNLIKRLRQSVIPSFFTNAFPNNYQITPSPALRHLSPFYLADHVENGWRNTWMGWINDYQGYNPQQAHNWIYTVKHGWVWARHPGSSKERFIWFYAPSLGWFQTGQTAYPWAWVQEEGRWVLLSEVLPKPGL